MAANTDYQRYENKWRKFLIVATGVFMSTLDSSMVNIALPAIMGDFHSEMAATEWVVLAYLLTITSTLLFWGHLGDRFGRGRIYGVGMLFFALGSSACTVSPSLSWLIFSRFVQAQGAAMLMATGPAVIKESFPSEQLGRALGLIGVSVSLGLMSGPSLGGFLIEYYSWRSLFFITVPIGLIFSFLAIRFIPKDGSNLDEAIDWPGAITWGAALFIFTLGLTHLTDPSWSCPLTLALLLLSSLLIMIFFRIEKKSRLPLLPPDLFRSRYFSMGILSAVLSFTALFSATILTPFYLDRLRELPPSQTGLVMAAIPAAIMLMSPVAGWLADKFEKRLIATGGILTSSLGVFLLSSTSSDTPILLISVFLAIIGGGLSLFLSPNSSAVLGVVKPQQAGSVAAILATSRNFGMLLGIALATLIFSILFTGLTEGLDMLDFRTGMDNEFMTAFKGALKAAAMLGFVGTLISWWRGKKEYRSETQIRKESPQLKPAD